MKFPPDHSPEAPQESEAEALEGERSRFLKALGFARGDAEEVVEEERSEPETSLEPEETSDELESGEILEPLENRSESAVLEASESGPVAENGFCEPIEDDEELVLKSGDEGPDFLALEKDETTGSDQVAEEVLTVEGTEEDPDSGEAKEKALSEGASETISDEVGESTSVVRPKDGEVPPEGETDFEARDDSDEARGKVSSEQYEEELKRDAEIHADVTAGTLDSDETADPIGEGADSPEIEPFDPEGSEIEEVTSEVSSAESLSTLGENASIAAETKSEEHATFEWAAPEGAAVGASGDPVESELPIEEESRDESPASMSASDEIPRDPDPDAASEGQGILDVACPACGKGLSLRKEHLGIAGHCVWCQAPIVACESAGEGRVRVFPLKSETDAGAVASAGDSRGLVKGQPQTGASVDSDEGAERDDSDFGWSPPVGGTPETEAKVDVEPETVIPESVDAPEEKPAFSWMTGVVDHSPSGPGGVIEPAPEKATLSDEKGDDPFVMASGVEDSVGQESGSSGLSWQKPENGDVESTTPIEAVGDSASEEGAGVGSGVLESPDEPAEGPPPEKIGSLTKLIEQSKSGVGPAGGLFASPRNGEGDSASFLDAMDPGDLLISEPAGGTDVDDREDISEDEGPASELEGETTGGVSDSDLSADSLRKSLFEKPEADEAETLDSKRDLGGESEDEEGRPEAESTGVEVEGEEGDDGADSGDPDSAEAGKAETAAAPGKARRRPRIAVALLGLMLLGVLAGAGTAFLFRDQIMAELLPRLAPLLEQGGGEAGITGGNEAPPTAGETDPAVSPESVEDESADSPETSPVVPSATEPEETNSPVSAATTESPGLAPARTEPATTQPQLIPESRSLFGSGSLLINDSASSDDSE